MKYLKDTWVANSSLLHHERHELDYLLKNKQTFPIQGWYKTDI